MAIGYLPKIEEMRGSAIQECCSSLECTGWSSWKWPNHLVVKIIVSNGRWCSNGECLFGILIGINIIVSSAVALTTLLPPGNYLKEVRLHGHKNILNLLGCGWSKWLDKFVRTVSSRLKVKMAFRRRCYWIKEGTVQHLADKFKYSFRSVKLSLFETTFLLVRVK